MNRMLMVTAIAILALSAHAESGPAAVGDDAKLLLKKVSMELIDMPLSEAMPFFAQISGLKIDVAQSIGDKSVSLKLNNSTLAEALRQIKEQAGGAYRIVDGRILIATPEEFTAIDAGKAKFEPYKEKEAAPVPNAVKTTEKATNSAKATAAGTGNNTSVQKSFSKDGKIYSEEEFKKNFPEDYAHIQNLEKGKSK